MSSINGRALAIYLKRKERIKAKKKREAETMYKLMIEHYARCMIFVIEVSFQYDESEGEDYAAGSMLSYDVEHDSIEGSIFLNHDSQWYTYDDLYRKIVAKDQAKVELLKDMASAVSIINCFEKMSSQIIEDMGEYLLSVPNIKKYYNVSYNNSNISILLKKETICESEGAEE